MSSILLIEDDAALARGLVDNLKFEGHTVHHETSCEKGMPALAKLKPDLVLLDLMLPGKSGFDFLRETASPSRPPVLVLSARDAETDIVRALDLGAADYLRKPFALGELLARVRVRLREKSIAEPANEFAFADVRIDFARFRLWKGKQEHLLSHLEVEILRFLIGKPDQPIQRAEILDRAWGQEAYPTERTVDNFIVKLRKKLETDPSKPRFLLTVHGYGYRFVPQGA